MSEPGKHARDAAQDPLSYAYAYAARLKRIQQAIDAAVAAEVGHYLRRLKALESLRDKAEARAEKAEAERDALKARAKKAERGKRGKALLEVT